MPEPDGPQFRNLWAAAIEESGFSLSDEELDDVRRAMPEGVEPTAENFERGHRLANLPLDENEDAYDPDDVRPVQQFVASDMTDTEGRTFRPNYDEPDPFDRSDPEQARQAKAIEGMNEALEE